MRCSVVRKRLEQNILSNQHFDWKDLCTAFHNMCKKCRTCQRAKTTNHKYYNLPPKQAETNPWYTLRVDLIGTYTIPWKGKKTLKLWCLTIINPATDWFEMAQILNKMAAEIAEITKNTLFTCYPLPQQIVFYCGTKFMAEVVKMCQNNDGLKRNRITTRKPQFNALIEQIYQTIGNIIRTFDVSNFINNDPWSCILAATMFHVLATYHTTLKTYPMKI